MRPLALLDAIGDVQVVDVRYPNEWEAGHIDGAVHISDDELDDRLGQLDRSRPVVAVCRSGKRSAAAARRLRDEGFDAQNLEGGVEAWAAEGLALVDEAGEPGRVVEPEPPPDDRPEHLQRLQSEFLRVLFDVDEHFGDRTPTEADIRKFLRDRMIDEGRSPEEADEILARMDESSEGRS